MNFSAFFTGAKSFYCEKSKVYESKEEDGRVRLRFLQPFHGFHSKFVQADDELLMMRCYKVKYGGWGGRSMFRIQEANAKSTCPNIFLNVN